MRNDEDPSIGYKDPYQSMTAVLHCVEASNITKMHQRDSTHFFLITSNEKERKRSERKVGGRGQGSEAKKDARMNEVKDE